MLAIERKEKIKEIILKDKRIFVGELSKQFNVSEETIRRDLDKLDKEGFVKKSYGGAILSSEINKMDIPFAQRAVTNLKEKREIALKTLSLLEDVKTIMVDASSTVLEVVKLLKTSKDLSIITNSIQVIKQLASSEINVIGIGGELNRKTLSFQGNITVKTLKKYNVDLAIISCKGLDYLKGVTDSNDEEVQIKIAMIENAKKVALLVDDSKIGEVAFLDLIDAKKIDYLIINNIVTDKNIIHFCKENDIVLL